MKCRLFWPHHKCIGALGSCWSGIGFQHAHCALACLLKDALTKGYGLHICAHDLSKAFDSAVHSQALYSLYSHDIIFHLFFFLSFSIVNLIIKIKLMVLFLFTVTICWGIWQGRILSPSILKFCISSILENISSMCFAGFTDISYLAYADDILLISWSKPRLLQMVHKVPSSFTRIGLLLNNGKCIFLSIFHSLLNL